MSEIPQVKSQDVLFEDNHLLVLNKPAELPTMGVAEGIPSVLTVAKDYIRRKYDKPGNVYLGVVSRLDAPVTGVLLIARTSKAAARLSKQFRERDVDKLYWAIVEGAPNPTEAELQHWLRKDERHRKMHVTMQNRDSAQEARLRYRVIRALPSNCTLLQIQLETGRKHQIRVQLSAIRHPVVGDRKYKGNLPFGKGIALHARRLEFSHPVKKERIVIEAPLPASWRPFMADR